MKHVLLATVFALGVVNAANADTLDDPLHGFCPTCVLGSGVGGANTPIVENQNGQLVDFGFNASPPSTGTLTLDFLVPSNISAPAQIGVTAFGGGSVGAATLFTNGFGAGLSVFQAGGIEGSNPNLPAFLGFNVQNPDNNLMQFLGGSAQFDPGVTGYHVFQLSGLGPFSLPTPGTAPPDQFSTSISVPPGTFVVGFLTEADGTEIGTANSSALLVTPFAAVPGPIVGAGFPGLVAMGLGMLALARRRITRWRSPA